MSRTSIALVLAAALATSCSGGTETSTPAPTAPTPGPTAPGPTAPAPPTPTPPIAPAPPVVPAPPVAPAPPIAPAPPTPDDDDADASTGSGSSALPTVPPAPPSAEAPAGAYFAATDSPLSRELYLDRVADQVDLRFHQRRVEEVRFWMQSGVVQLRGAAPRGLGDPVAGGPTRTVQRARIGNVVTRRAWVVPLGNTTLERRRAIALGTTRCLVDYRYPIAGVDVEWRNFALFSDNGRNHEVFRLAGIPELFGVNATFDPRADRLVITSQRHLDGRQAERYFDQFLSGAMPPAGARVALGEWRDGSGLDFVVLSIPLDDPGVAAIAPQRNLGIARHQQVLRETLEARPYLWPNRFEFLPRSGRCQTDADYATGTADWDAGRGEVYAATSGLDSVLAILGRPLGEVGSIVVRRFVDHGRRAQGTVWRNGVQTLRASEVRDVAWSPQGKATLSIGGARGRPSSFVLAGIVRDGLDDAAAARVIDSIRAIAAADGAVLSILRADGHAAVGSLTVPRAGLDVSAELLRRGRARLDLSDRATIAQQPSLVVAARRATVDSAVQGNPAISDGDYRSRIAEILAE